MRWNLRKYLFDLVSWERGALLRLQQGRLLLQQLLGVRDAPFVLADARGAGQGLPIHLLLPKQSIVQLILGVSELLLCRIQIQIVLEIGLRRQALVFWGPVKKGGAR